MLAIIGGSGLYDLQEFGQPQLESVATDYATSAVDIELYDTAQGQLAFLPRHGKQHSVAPHLVNYRANIAALATVGVTEIIAINAVGGIDAHAAPGSLILPTQIIDYSWGRASTFWEKGQEEVVHVDFTNPFSVDLGRRLLAAVYQRAELDEDSRTVLKHGTYGCTQGPRLETAAEILRMKQDGCDIVGMTGMPETVLAREKEIDYAMLALSVNWAAGVVPGIITMDEIRAVMKDGIGFIRKVLVTLLTTTE